MRNPTALRDVTTAGNIDTSRAVKMGIDPEAMSIIMSTLSNMYSDGNFAIVREYACNARDSHVEAGQPLPIEVTLPTPLAPQLKVQDYGIGLSHEGILQTYAQYGTSTKRTSNEQIGSFGIGSKSAFTVGNQFTVTGIKDGEKTIAMFSLTEDGTPMVQVLYNGPTDEGNGVTVEIGVEDVHAVREAAKRFFRYWKSGTVLVDNEEPVSVWSTDLEEIVKDTYVDWSRKDRYSDYKFELLMGGVPYRIPTTIWRELDRDAQALYHSAAGHEIGYLLDVPIGAVDIAPNREDLRVTPRTRATLNRMLGLLRSSLGPWMTTKIDQAPTMWEAAKIYSQLSGRLNFHPEPSQVYWRSVSLGQATVRMDYPNYWLSTTNGRYNYKTGSYANTTRTKQASFYAAAIGGSFDKILFVTDVPTGKENIVRLYARSIMENGEDGYTHIVASPRSGEHIHWFSYGVGADSDVPSMTFEDYHKLGKSLRTPRGTTPRSKTTYSTEVPGNASELLTADDIIDLGYTPLVRQHRHDTDYYPTNPVHKAFVEQDDYVIVTLNGTQKLSVLEKNLGIKLTSFGDAVKDFAQKLLVTAAPDDIRILKAHEARHEMHSSAVTFVQTHAGSITNQAVIDAVNAHVAKANLTDAEMRRINFLNQVYDTAQVSNPYLSHKTDADEYFFKHFPLLRVYLRNTYTFDSTLTPKNAKKALIDYINNTSV